MMRIAEKVALENKMEMLITGESLGQVASQTMKSMTVIENAIDIIVQIDRLTDGRRKVTSISEVDGLENGDIQIGRPVLIKKLKPNK